MVNIVNEQAVVMRLLKKLMKNVVYDLASLPINGNS